MAYEQDRSWIEVYVKVISLLSYAFVSKDLDM